MSFSQEMKDFLGAYEKGQKINASRTDQDYKEQLTKTAKQTYDENEDPESVTNQTEAAKLAHLKSTMANSASSTASLNALRAEQLKQLKLQGAGGMGSGLYPTGAINPGAPGPQPTPGGVLPIGPSTMDTEAYADGGLYLMNLIFLVSPTK